jgi:hypothetical protein
MAEQDDEKPSDRKPELTVEVFLPGTPGYEEAKAARLARETASSNVVSVSVGPTKELADYLAKGWKIREVFNPEDRKK